MKPILALAALLLLTGCDEQNPIPPNSQLPPFPADLSACFKQAGVTLPNRKLTAGEVEKFWKTDRKAIVVQRLCGARVESWYAALRRDWR